MGHHSRINQSSRLLTHQLNTIAPVGPNSPSAADAALERIVRHITAGNYPKALDLLRAAPHTPSNRNALGVCLLRMGRIEEALRVYRNFVLAPGCTWMRHDLPTVYKTNFATALLLAGHPNGCLELLAEIHDQSQPAVERLLAVIARWEAGLAFWQRLAWKLGRFEPDNCRVSLEFTPGEFDIAVTPESIPQSTPSALHVPTAV